MSKNRRKPLNVVVDVDNQSEKREDEDSLADEHKTNDENSDERSIARDGAIKVLGQDCESLCGPCSRF